MKAQEDHRTLWGEDHMQALAWEEDHMKAQVWVEDHKMVLLALGLHKTAQVQVEASVWEVQAQEALKQPAERREAGLQEAETTPPSTGGSAIPLEKAHHPVHGAENAAISPRPHHARSRFPASVS